MCPGRQPSRASRAARSPSASRRLPTRGCRRRWRRRPCASPRSGRASSAGSVRGSASRWLAARMRSRFRDVVGRADDGGDRAMAFGRRADVDDLHAVRLRRHGFEVLLDAVGGREPAVGAHAKAEVRFGRRYLRRPAGAPPSGNASVVRRTTRARRLSGLGMTPERLLLIHEGPAEAALRESAIVAPRCAADRPRIRHARVPLECRLHGGALHAASAAVDEPHLARAPRPPRRRRIRRRPRRCRRERRRGDRARPRWECGREDHP